MPRLGCLKNWKMTHGWTLRVTRLLTLLTLLVTLLIPLLMTPPPLHPPPLRLNPSLVSWRKVPTGTFPTATARRA